MNKSYILKKLATTRIKMAQIDPFSYCNAGCWFCPVRYTPNPADAKKHMPIDMFEKIIANLIEEKHKEDGLVDTAFDFIYTAHYNEILLYKHFSEMLDILKKYKVKTYVLTNGIPLTPDKTDIIKANKDVVIGIYMNIPAFEKEIWSKRSGMNAALFDRLISNIKYAEENLTHFTENGKKQLSIQINGANNQSFYESGGYLEKGKNFPVDMDLDPNTGELKRQFDLCKSLFPSINTFSVNTVIDRAGLLSELGIISNKRSIETKIKKNTGDVVIGCNHHHEVGGRPFGWLHVNALGRAFLCCNDYNFDYSFGSFETEKLSDFWLSERHAETIAKAYKEICTNCTSAKWGAPV